MISWRRCADPECDVRWKGGATCWACGGPAKKDSTSSTAMPRIGDQYAYAAPMTPDAWAQVRRDIGVN